jgi:TusA-related sulfurtransferase
MTTEAEALVAFTADHVVDARGTLCPMPIVLLNRAVRAAAPGAVVKLLATDRGAKADVPAWADDTENELLGQGTEEGALVFWIRRSA